MAEQKSSSALTAPLRGAASALRRVPGAGTVGRAAEETLDKIGAVSPRGRRLAVYAGAGVLGAAGVVEWPVALTGAAVAWLTQPRPAHPPTGESEAGQQPEPAHDLGTAALRSGHGGAATGGAGTEAAAGATGENRMSGTGERTTGGGHTSARGGAGTAEGSRTSAPGSGARTHGGGHTAPSSGAGTAEHGAGQTSASSRAAGTAASSTAGTADASGGATAAGPARGARRAEGSAGKPSSGPLGPTARPDRTTL